MGSRQLLVMLFLLFSASCAVIGVSNTIYQTTAPGSQSFNFTVANTGNEPLRDIRIQIGNWADSEQFNYSELKNGSAINGGGTLAVPNQDGSYPIFVNTTVRNFLNKDFNIISVAEYYLGQPKRCDLQVIARDIELLDRNHSTITITDNGTEAYNASLDIITSSEFGLPETMRFSINPGETKEMNFTIYKQLAEFNTANGAFAVVQSRSGGLHCLSLAKFQLSTRDMEPNGVSKDLIFGACLAFMVFVSYFVTFRWFRKDYEPKMMERKGPLYYGIKYVLIAALLTLVLQIYDSSYFELTDIAKEALRTIYYAFMIYAIPYSFKWPLRFFGEKDNIDVLMDYASGSLKDRDLKRNFTPQVRTSALIFVVRAFFLQVPVMFTLGNFQALNYHLQVFSFDYQPFDIIFVSGFHAVMFIMFVIDTLVYSLSYAFESPWLGNRTKSVDPTLAGWFVTLICYPPLTSFVHQYLPQVGNDWADFNSFPLTAAMRMAGFVFFFIYLWGGFSLGMRGSNLTNRGIVTDGPYKHIRHPVYAAKNAAWLVFGLSTLDPILFSMQLVWAGIYALRAYTEENHLSADQEYLEYKKNVPWMFIPGVW